MRIRKHLLTACIAAGAMTIPAAAAVASHPRDLLHDIAYNSQVTERDAGRLSSYSANGLDWQAQGRELTTLKQEINHMSRDVQQLQSQPMSPGQQRLVNRVARRVNMLASDTQDAIVTGKEHRDYLWDRSYQKDVRRIYKNSESLTHDASAALHFTAGNEGLPSD